MSNLTDVELTEKLTADPHACPGCGSDDVNQAGAPEGGRVLSLPVKCDSCGATWTEHYRFASASDFEEDDG